MSTSIYHYKKVLDMRIDYTAEQLAKDSFEIDVEAQHANNTLEEGAPIEWDKVPADEKEIYLREAQEYMSMPLSEWPVSILERLKFHD